MRDMAYDESLADRLRVYLRQRDGFVEKKMFGGLGFLLNGNMCVGVWKDALIVRVGQDSYAAALGEPTAREFDITGRPMRGWVMVGPEGVDHLLELARWVERAIAFVETLPAK